MPIPTLPVNAEVPVTASVEERVVVQQQELLLQLEARQLWKEYALLTMEMLV